MNLPVRRSFLSVQPEASSWKIEQAKNKRKKNHIWWLCRTISKNKTEPSCFLGQITASVNGCIRKRISLIFSWRQVLLYPTIFHKSKDSGHLKKKKKKTEIPGRKAMQSIFLIFQVKTQSMSMQAVSQLKPIHLASIQSTQKRLENFGFWIPSGPIYFIKYLRISVGFQGSSKTLKKKVLKTQPKENNSVINTFGFCKS